MTSGERSQLDEYDTLRDSLTRAGAILALPELHGGICGALCASGPAAAEVWLAEGFDEPGAQPVGEELLASLHGLVTQSWQLLSSGELKFEPLLPDEDAPLDEQVHALASWCHGFLGGLGFAAPDLGAGAELEEICADFVEISRAGLTDDDAADRNRADFALAELREYVRAGVQIAFESLAQRRAGAASARDHLH